MKKITIKKINRSKYFILIFVIIFFMIMSFVLKDNRNLTFIEKSIKDSILFINKTIMYPLTIIDKNNNEKNNILKENIKKETQSELDNIENELNELKKDLELNNLLSDYDFINATVINRNLGYWYNQVIIDKGIKDGIKKNMAVTTYGGLIGKVVKVSNNNSTIKLLTNDDNFNKVSVQIKTDNKYLYGILTSFNKKEGYYIVDGIDCSKDIKVGSLVSTTGMGDIFPSGILIGEVAKVDKDNFDLEAIIKVKPSVNVNNFNYVKVLRRKA